MNLNKKIVKTMIFALALGILPFSTKSLAKASTNEVFDAKTGIYTAATSTKHWAIVKTLKTAKGATFSKSDKHYKVVGDVEKYSPSGIYLAGFGSYKDISFAYGATEKPSADWTVKDITMPKDDKSFKAGYVANSSTQFNKVAIEVGKAIGSADVGYIAFTEGKPAKVLDKANVIFKKTGGKWAAASTLDENDLKRILQSGGSLTFKKAGTESTWGSKEVTVKIPATAKAPKVVADLKTNTFGTKKGMEYKVLKAGDSAPSNSAWKSVSEANKYKISFAEILADGGNLGEFTKNWEVAFRTATTSKKLASKEAKLIFKKQDSLTKAPAGDDLATDWTKPNENPGVILKDKAEVNSVKPLVTFKPVLAYVIEKKGMELLNLDTANDYEFYIDWDKNTPFIGKDVKWVTLKKAASETKPTKITVKASTTKKAGTFSLGKAGQIHIRLSGKKQSKENVVVLPSPEVKLGFTINNVAQDFTLNNVTSSNKEVELNIAAPKMAKEFKLPLVLTNIQDENANITAKLSKKPDKGITVTLPKKFNSKTASVDISVSEEVFLEDGDFAKKGKFSITFSSEGTLNKTFNISFKKADS